MPRVVDRRRVAVVRHVADDRQRVDLLRGQPVGEISAGKGARQRLLNDSDRAPARPPPDAARRLRCRARTPASRPTRNVARPPPARRQRAPRPSRGRCSPARFAHPGIRSADRRVTYSFCTSITISARRGVVMARLLSDKGSRCAARDGRCIGSGDDCIVRSAAVFADSDPNDNFARIGPSLDHR